MRVQHYQCNNNIYVHTIYFCASSIRPDPESISYFMQQDAILLLLLIMHTNKTNSIVCDVNRAFHITMQHNL